jgi:hypothetical protein
MEEELLSGFVFRLATIKHDFPANSAKLHIHHLQIEDDELRRAAQLGRAPMVSVWNCERTAVSQAQEMRHSQEESVAFGFDVEKIRMVQVKLPSAVKSLRVFRDPLDPPSSELPGAAGHCGIWGLHHRKGEEKKPYKLAREALVAHSSRHSD